MSTRLDDLVASHASRASSELDQVWDLDRSERVREGTLRRRDVRTRRDRALRRGALVAGGAALLLLTLLRVASSAPSEPVQVQGGSAPLDPESVATLVTVQEPLAIASSSGDAGYSRD